MKFKVFIILAMVALVFVFTVTANPAPEEHVAETLVQKPDHASEDHHAAAGKSAAAHSRHVKRVRDGKKHREPIGRRPREVKAATKEHKKGAIATKEATPTKTGVPIKAGATAPIHVPEGAPAVGLHAPLRVKPRQPKVIWNAPKKPVAG
ncbi:uncharacterized protein LOC124313447 isoform X3 [Daphnia pulicaria]|uniref:uncharacterized protein LOC124313447 isoform X3 n=1 Tax=Daphnia pulicaria TaxID=35523 RepID=UPI001EEBFD95|nr:uncharacterized protein LOC124313447 isoform X3 [Daphnia pulicaria]